MAQQKPTLVVSGTVIEKDGRYLLVQEKMLWAYGKWSLPAGHVDEGETLEQAAVRETKEECGLDVEVTKHLLTLHLSSAEIERPDNYARAELHGYAARITGGELRFPKEEILDARWFTYEEIKVMEAKDEIRAPRYNVAAIEKMRSS